MFAQFETYIKEQAQLSDTDIQLIRSRCVEKTLRKKDFLLQQGDICRYKTFVCKGLLRNYITKADGNEYILHFAPENSWTTDMDSYENRTPSAHHIEAMENCELILWTKNDFEYLFTQIPALKTYSEKLISKNLHITRQRVFSSISSSAEEKYDYFTKTYPELMARVPLHMVASYLGVSRETLSRIRHAQVK